MARTASGAITLTDITDGTAGARGAGRWNIDVDNVDYATGTDGRLPITPADSQFAWDNGVFVGNSPGTQVSGDQAWFFQGSESMPTGQSVWIYDGSAWVEQDEVIDGNLLVSGTVSANDIRAGQLQNPTNPPGTAGAIPGAGEAGTHINMNNGRFTFGDATNSIRFDGTNLTITGRIISVNNISDLPVTWGIGSGSATFAYAADGTTISSRTADVTITATPSVGTAETATYRVRLASGVNFDNLVAASVTATETADTTSSFSPSSLSLINYYEVGIDSKHWVFMGSHDEAGQFFIMVEANVAR